MKHSNSPGEAALSSNPNPLNISDLIRQYVHEAVAEALAATMTTTQAPDPDELLTLAQVAKALGVCRSQVDKLIRYHALPFSVIGSVKRVHRGMLRQWTESQIQVAA